MAKRRIALFGGTFDPIHAGHTTVATAAAAYIGVEKVVFVPAKCSPLKTSHPEASDEGRLAMIALAIAGHKQLEASDCELKKAKPSYTLETVRQFQSDYGSDTSIFWLMGADALDDLPLWYRAVDLIDECDLCVMFRAGFEPPDFAGFQAMWGPGRIDKLRRNVIRTPLVDVSSTEIRTRLAAGQDVENMLHPAVAEYIRKRGLYRSKTKS
ncbi:MAG: nicotinate (nicotinamide) nucleotide adenylyltransferase [Planctomycetota bacterium]|jgi:nicotinate-nucleotide adenylyltransferase